jgi:hypothetical protein
VHRKLPHHFEELDFPLLGCPEEFVFFKRSQLLLFRKLPLDPYALPIKLWKLNAISDES